jgi:hypothetical protein
MTDFVSLPASPLWIDPQTPTAELYLYAARRFGAARDLTQSLTCLTLQAGDEQDLKAVAEVLSVLLEDGCKVFDVLEKRVAHAPPHSLTD